MLKADVCLTTSGLDVFLVGSCVRVTRFPNLLHGLQLLHRHNRRQARITYQLTDPRT